MRRGLVGRLAVAALVVAGGCRGGGDDGQAPREEADVEAVTAKLSSLTLSEPVALVAKGRSAPSVVAANRSGDVYLAWVEDGFAGLRVVVVRSQDGGRSFSEPVMASGADTDVAAAPARLGLGPEGEVYVLYEREVAHERFDYYSRRPGPAAESPQSGRRVLRLARSTDNGRTFEAVDVGAADVEAARTSTSMADLLVAPDGDVFVAWLDFREEFALLALPANERPGLTSLSIEDPTAPRVEVRVARSTDGGASFEKSVRVDDAASERAPVALAAGPGGGLHVVWRSKLHRSRETYGTALRDVMVSTSTDGGWSWSSRAKVHDDRFNVSECPGVTSGVATDSTGRVHVAWYSGARRAAGFYYARSDDGAKTFSEPVTLLHDDWVPYGEATVAVDGDDNAWVVFTDNRTDTPRFVVGRIGPRGGVSLSPPRPGTAADLSAGRDGALVTWTTDDGAVAVASTPG